MMMAVWDAQNQEWLQRHSVDAQEMLRRAPARYSLVGPADAPPKPKLDPPFAAEAE